VGRWGTGSFENDDAKDWLAKLGTITPDDLMQIFVQAVDDPGYLEERAACVAVAAAETVSALNGSPADATPTEILEWASKNQQAVASELTDLAIRALERVRRNSELKDLWLEADGLNDWTAAIQGLQTRLGN
jgi:hypothetical protein